MNLKFKKTISYGTIALSVFLLSPLHGLALDQDADGKSDLTVFRPDSPITPGTWFVSSTALSGALAYQWGLSGDYPVPGNYSDVANPRGADLAVWRPTDGVWYLRYYNVGLTYPTAEAYQWGLPGDVPLSCDFDGDDRSELTVWRPSNGTWYLRNSDGNSEAFDRFTVQQWGLPGDLPVARDYDSDGKCDFTVFRDGNWYVILSSENGAVTATIPWGAAGDVPVPGHYDGDTILDFAVYRENSASGPLWVIRRSTLAGLTYKVVQWGLPGDLPVPSDYTGDGKTDIAVFRPSTSVWYVLTSESSYATSEAYQFGLTGDIPVGDTRGTDPL